MGFLLEPCKWVIRRTTEVHSVMRRWPADNGVSAEAEESSLLETITRERLLKRQQNKTSYRVL
jgi:hypothetical protein